MTVTTGTTFDVPRAQAYLKHTYANRVNDMVPESDKIAKELDFIEKEKQPGLIYNQPVLMGREMGATFNTGGDLFRLNKPLARSPLNAQIQGNECVVRSAISYGAMNRALKGDMNTRAGMRAFVNATKDTVTALVKGASFFREVQLLYGGGPGVGSVLGTVTATTGSAGTTLVATLAAGDWATALWVGSEGGEYDIYSTGAVKRNSAGTDTDTVYRLVSVAVATYQLTYTSHATNVSNVVATDQIFFAGARTKEMLGLVGACQTVGTLWGLSTSQYALWQPKTTNVAGALTFEQIMRGVTKVAEIGFYGTLNIHTPCASWQDMADDQAALVRHADKAGGTVEMGYEEITFYGQTGKVRVKPNIYMKRSLAIGLPEGMCKRVGSSDITLEMPGFGKMIRELEDYAGVEHRSYWEQAPFVESPAFMHLWTGIVNTSD